MGYKTISEIIMADIKSMELSEMTIANFKGKLNQTFNCSSPVSCEFELSEVYAHVEQDDPRVTRPPFSLIFKAPSSI